MTPSARDAARPGPALAPAPGATTPARRAAPARVFDEALASTTALVIDARCLVHVTKMD